ncbi:PRC-barrel domain-containing protein [Haloferula sp. BvORR071]|uniref:PRC-barrel domain-containing protein n=1 Tax=Haloferula sp. BvORR071 TaxID=1396141 RepID=UPI000698C965|nr:PRC-barrel domain-containing protein [Haloferula sp. BvORR071]
MLYNIKSAYGQKLVASDGDIGHVKDFYFEEQTGAIRYMVVDTGLWLMKRLVLLSPHAFEKVPRSEKVLAVKLTRKQIEESPSIQSHRPVSRSFEKDYYRHYGWPPYWEDADVGGDTASPAKIPDKVVAEEAPPQRHRHEYVRLFSTHGIAGYDVQASDGSIGSVSSFMVDDQTWIIGEWVIETGHWYDGKQILLPASAVTRIDHDESKVFLEMAKWDIQRKGAHLGAKAAALHS